MANTKSSILLIPDGFNFKYSGYATAVYAAKVLNKMGYKLAAFAEYDGEQKDYPYIKFYNDRKPFKTRSINDNSFIKEYEDVLDDFKPQFIFVHGAAVNKFPFYYDAAMRRGIKVVTMWLINDYFCAKNWAVKDNMPCYECAKGNFTKAIVHNCYPAAWIDNVSELKKRKNQLTGLYLRSKLRPRLLKNHKVIGSGKPQVKMYRDFGYTNEQIIECPFFYDPERIPSVNSKRGDYFIFLGQHSETKGWTLISRIMDLCPEIKFITPLMDTAWKTQSTIKKFGFQKHIESGQLKIVTGKRWGTGVENLVAESCGVINPSLWDSTGESVLMESLGLKKPVVVFDIGVHKEIFRDKVNGLIAPLNDIKGFAERIKYVYGINNDEYERISQNARSLFDYLTSDSIYIAALEEAFT